MSDNFEDVFKIASASKLYQEAIDNGFKEIERLKDNEGERF